MLGKLLKYEMKASARTLLPLYIGTLAVALVCGIQVTMLISSEVGTVVDSLFAGNSIILAFTFLLFFALCVAIVVLTAMIIIQRFNKNLIGDEGYLMFTLPVSHVQLLTSKLTAGLLWVIVGTVVMGLAGIIICVPAAFVAAADQVDWAYFWNEVQYLFNMWNPFASIGLWIVDVVLTIVATILTVYISIMIGQTEQFDKHRVAVSVVAFFLINWLFTFVYTNLLYLLSYSTTSIMDATAFTSVINGMLGIDIVMTLIQCAICFAGTIWFMKKKLNL